MAGRGYLILMALAFLRPHICPTVSFFHMLLTIALPRACIRAGRELALVPDWLNAVLVVDMAVALLFSGPTVLEKFAAGLAAFPRAGMSFAVFAGFAFALVV